MSLDPQCPRCPAPLAKTAAGWTCQDHGAVDPLWRVSHASYDAFGDYLARAQDFPSFVPWPMSPGWEVTDFGVVAGDRARATVLGVAGTSPLDGPVEVVVVSEEPGTGLGARCAGTVLSDPGAQIAESQPTARVKVAGQTIPLWTISTSDADQTLDRSVFAGEAWGRWLWLVLRPASAMLLLADEWILTDASSLGPALVELPFGGHPPAW
jgi:hypothetical protein